MKYIVSTYLILPLSLFSQYHWTESTSGNNVSVRGMSVVDDKVAWLGGDSGRVCLSKDGGMTWKTIQVKGYKKDQFRSIYAFDGVNAIIANAGSPGVVLMTTDGGQSWEEVYENDHPDFFIDGIDFWDGESGLIYGDGINGRMLLLTTNDGGGSWSEAEESQRPELEEGEAGFAASGTGIRCIDENRKWMIATGGSNSRIWHGSLNQSEADWIEVPILQGIASQGIFSFAKNKDHIVVVGGDYKAVNQKLDHVFYSHDGGKNWFRPEQATRGYRECVEYIRENDFLCIGPNGGEYSLDGGASWNELTDAKGFHVIRKARKGELILAAGKSGKIGIVKKILE